MQPLNSLKDNYQVMVVAHRGSSGTAPENSMSAIREAISAGAQMIEVDIRVTADQQVVLFHDSTLERTSDGHGKIHNLPLAEIQNLDCGSWFDQRFGGEQIPLLREALALIQGRCYLNIEIKPPQPEEDFLQRIDLLLAIIRRFNYSDKTLFSSFHYPSLHYLKLLDRSLNTAAILKPENDLPPSIIVRETGSDALVCSLAQLSPSARQDIKTNRIIFGAYTVNSEQDLQKALSAGARAVVTNFPRKIKKLLTSPAN